MMNYPEPRRVKDSRHRFLALRLGLLIASTVTSTATFAQFVLPPQSDSGQNSGSNSAGQENASQADSQMSVSGSSGLPSLRPEEIDDDTYRREDMDSSGSKQLSEKIGPAAPPGEFEQFVSELADKDIRRFGASMLVPDSRGFAQTPATSIPADYRINPGDQLIVGLTGSIVASNLKVTVDRDGRIFIPRIGAVYVGGVRYGEVQSVIARQVSRFYRGFDVSVTMGRLRGITVYVTGFAATPGSYTVSSLSTLVNAVFQAGGPSAGGSFRSIQLRRGGKLVSDFDLYDLLLKGDKSGDSVLQNGDVIYIAPTGPQVAVVGSVNQESIYEAAPQDTLQNILLYAGGVNTVADNARLLVLDPLRTETTGWEELTPDMVQTRVAKRGEIIRVLSGVGIANALSQQPVLVTISGEVDKPGRYYFQPGVRIADVLSRAGGLTGDAYPFATVFSRQSVQMQQRQSFERAIGDIETALTAQPLTSTRRNELSQAGQLEMVQSVVAQLRNRKPDGRIVLDIAESSRSLPGDMKLENNDAIHVPAQPVTVGVFGAVPSPASFKYQGGLTIGTYLSRAGGVQKIGDRSEIFVVRANGMVISNNKGGGIRNVLGAKALPGDLVFVPVNASRGEVWAKIRDITQIVFAGALTAATAYGVTK